MTFRHEDEAAFRAWAAGAERPDDAERAAEEMAPALRGAGFALFRNGGRPKFERRDLGLVVEVVVRAAPGGAWAELHASHPEVAPVRLRYAPGRRTSEALVSSLNVGLLAHPRPFWTGWSPDDAGAGTVHAALAAEAYGVLTTPRRLAEARFLDSASILDLMLAQGDEGRARDLLRRWRTADSRLARELADGASRLSVPWSDATPRDRLVALARTFRLL